jgi:hypothetical protein
VFRTINPNQLDQKVIAICKLDHSLDWGDYSESVQLEAKEGSKDGIKPSASTQKPKPNLRVETGDEAKVYPSADTVRSSSILLSPD